MENMLPSNYIFTSPFFLSCVNCLTGFYATFFPNLFSNFIILCFLWHLRFIYFLWIYSYDIHDLVVLLFFSLWAQSLYLSLSSCGSLYFATLLLIQLLHFTTPVFCISLLPRNAYFTAFPSISFISFTIVALFSITDPRWLYLFICTICFSCTRI